MPSYGVFDAEGGDADPLVLINWARVIFVDDNEALVIQGRGAVGMFMDADLVSGQEVIDHGLGTGRSVHMQRHRPISDPGGDNHSGQPGRMVRVQMGEEDVVEILQIKTGYTAAIRLSRPVQRSGAAIDEIGAIVDDDRGGLL